MAKEIELKLAFPPAARASILAHPLLANAPRMGPEKTLINTYFDTPGMALSARRIALRTRKSGNEWLQTVKCAADSFGGLSSRPEWEQAFSGEFDFSAIEADAPRKLLEKHRATIVPLFTTNFRRETLLLTPCPGVRVLVMVDTGEISANGNQEQISELELELESGTADDLLALACELAASLPLLAYDASKAARGYALFRRERAEAQKIPAPSFTAHCAPLDAFRQAAFGALSCWASNHHGAIDSDDPEFIHQLRLALRQLRNLIRLFAAALPTDFVEHWQACLREEAQHLGEVRDLDVLCDETLLAAREGDSDQRLSALIEHAEHTRQQAHAQVRNELSQAGAGCLLLQLNRALHALPATESIKIQSLAKTALKTLHKQAQRKLANARSEQTSTALHELRISVKRLRHAQDCFQFLDTSQSQLATAHQLARLQNQLGQLHDLDLSITCLNAWGQAHPGLREAIAFVTGWHAATSLKLRRRILPRCEKMLARS